MSRGTGPTPPPLYARLRGALWGTAFARWFWVGVINTLFSLAVYQMAVLVMPYAAAYTLAFVSGILTAAWGQSRFAFATKLRARSLVRFTAAYLLTYAGGLALLALLIDYAGLHKAVAPFVVLVVQVPLSFLMSRIALRDRQG